MLYVQLNDFKPKFVAVVIATDMIFPAFCLFCRQEAREIYFFRHFLGEKFCFMATIFSLTHSRHHKDHSWLFSPVEEETGRFREVILAVGETLLWPLPLQRVLNMIQCIWPVRRDKTKVAVVLGCGHQEVRLYNLKAVN